MSDDAALYRPILDGKKFEPLIFHPKCKKVSAGKGNTLFSVKRMADVVNEYSWHITPLAKLLQKRSLNLSELCQNIQDFLFWHIQYKQDGRDQLLRSPGCAWKERKTGIDCKSYSIFAASILKELGVKSWFRRVSYTKGEPYKHVYLVVPINQENPDLDDKNGYFFIDGTININTNGRFEPYFYKKDDFMSNNLDHYMLAKPQLGNPSYRDLFASKLPANENGLGNISSDVSSILQDAKNTATSAATTYVNNTVNTAKNDAKNSIESFIKGIFSGPTGAAGVDMENDRKVGDPYFHNAKIGGKWRDFDFVLKQMGKGGLESFGWKFGKTPRSAQGIFKDAEDAFFSVLAPFLDAVVAGQLPYPESFLNDPIMISYMEKVASTKYSTPTSAVSVKVPDTTTSTPTKTTTLTPTNALLPSKALTISNQTQTKQAGGGAAGLVIATIALGGLIYGFTQTKGKPKKATI